MKQQLRTDLTASMKARDGLTTGTLRMAITAVTNEEVAGSTAKELTDADVIRVLQREVKKRTESAEVYDGAGRPELAAQERAEITVLARYLPEPLTDDELGTLVQAAVAHVQDGGERPTLKQMGAVIKEAGSRAAGRAEGGRIAAAVKAALA